MSEREAPEFLLPAPKFKLRRMSEWAHVRITLESGHKILTRNPRKTLRNKNNTHINGWKSVATYDEDAKEEVNVERPRDSRAFGDESWCRCPCAGIHMLSRASRPLRHSPPQCSRDLCAVNESDLEISCPCCSHVNGNPLEKVRSLMWGYSPECPSETAFATPVPLLPSPLFPISCKCSFSSRHTLARSNLNRSLFAEECAHLFTGSVVHLCQTFSTSNDSWRICPRALCTATKWSGKGKARAAGRRKSNPHLKSKQCHLNEGI